MGKDQLFRVIPSDDLIATLLSFFGLASLDDGHYFSRNDLIHLDTVRKLELLKPLLSECYLPCKARTYLSDITPKNSITLLRQCVRTRGLSVRSKEKYMKGDKFILYNLEPLYNNTHEPVLNVTYIPSTKKVNNIPTIITFN